MAHRSVFVEGFTALAGEGQVLRRHHLGGCSVRDQVPRQQERVREMLPHQLDIVQHRHDGSVFSVPV
ncbi:MAG TPA: hypothetical protein VKA18_15035, partial [Alphaproteobacteria bacterium]|nr:hypothetical protein [Alphaproteobacteria bacterium]